MDAACLVRPAGVTAAYQYAERQHLGATRRDGESPYFEHVVAVAGLVARSGGSDLLVTAAFLHDVVERTDATIGELAARFGSGVASTVDQMTRQAVDAETGEPLGWLEQRSLAIIALRTAPRGVIWLKAADVCTNAGELLGNLARFGSRAWTRYDASPAHQVGYYLRLGDELLEPLDNAFLRDCLTLRMSALRDTAVREGIRCAFPALTPPNGMSSEQAERIVRGSSVPGRGVRGPRGVSAGAVEREP